MVWRANMMLAAGLLLAACSGGGEGQSYPLPAQAVHGKLYIAQLLRDVCGQDYGIQDSAVRMEGQSPDRISWIISSRGKDWIRLTADMEPQGDGATAVALQSKLILKEEAPAGTFTGASGDHSLIVAQADAMFREKVDATLQGRPFEFRRVVAQVDEHLGYPTPPDGTKRVEDVRDVAPHMDRYAVDSRREMNPPRNATGERANCQG